MSEAWTICRCCGKTFIYCAIHPLFHNEAELEYLYKTYPPRFCSTECKELSENEKHWEEPRAPAMRKYGWE